jgi:hypothetical protein
MRATADSLGVPEFSDGYGELAADDIDGVNSPFAGAFVAELKVLGREGYGSNQQAPAPSRKVRCEKGETSP